MPGGRWPSWRRTPWGLVFHEIKGERFVVVPDGALADPPWWVDDRPALKLSRE